MLTRSTGLAGLVFLFASSASAAPPVDGACRAIADPTERLACYDRAASQDTPSAASPARAAAPAAPPTAAASAPVVGQTRAAMPADREAKAVTAGRIAAVSPLRHGYFRLELEGGPAYETTVVGTPPPVGAEVRIRNTLFGTTFFDIKGWSPISVRRSRVQ